MLEAFRGQTPGSSFVSRTPVTVLAPPFAACLVAAMALSGGAEARKPRVRYHPDWKKHASTRYAAMSADACTAELGRRGIAWTPVAEAAGVRIPVRLPKDVDGVVYRTEAPAHVRETSPYDVFDCRLALALSDFSRVLKAHDVDQARMFSAFRPSRHVHDGDEGARHAGGLAIDIARFGKKLAPGETERDRVWLDVLHDFHGRIGAPVCGAGAAPPFPATKAAREIRSIACEAADQHFFTSILTPNYDRAHRNHFHMEVTPNVRWYLVL
jgi:hypothetical protein